MKTLLCVLLLLATGCVPDIDDGAGSIGVDVLPAQGGGGKLSPATIPIVVRVEVEQRRQSPIIINDRDEFADDTCDCGCDMTDCNCQATLDSSETQKSFTPDRMLPNQTSGTSCQTWVDGGNLYWIADGVQWYLETGGTLAEGQAVQGGRFVMRGGKIVDTQATVTAEKPRYVKQCDDTGCRLIRVN